LLDNLYKLFSTTEINISLDSVSHYPRMISNNKLHFLNKKTFTLQIKLIIILIYIFYLIVVYDINIYYQIFSIFIYRII